MAFLIVNGWLLLTCAISAYDNPCANSVSISRSRCVSLSHSRLLFCSAAARIPAKTLLMTSPGIRYSPSATSLTALSSFSLPEYFWRYPVAPAATASITASSSAAAVRISTLVSGSISVISRQASMPFFSGIITSMITTSGLICRAILTAASPSPAWPTTSKPPARWSTSRSPSLIISWSSTSSTLVCSDVSKSPASSICIIRDDAGYRGPTSGLAV